MGKWGSQTAPNSSKTVPDLSYMQKGEWGGNEGLFSNPSEKFLVVSFEQIQEKNYIKKILCQEWKLEQQNVRTCILYKFVPNFFC